MHCRIFKATKIDKKNIKELQLSVPNNKQVMNIIFCYKADIIDLFVLTGESGEVIKKMMNCYEQHSSKLKYFASRM